MDEQEDMKINRGTREQVNVYEYTFPNMLSTFH